MTNDPRWQPTLVLFAHLGSGGPAEQADGSWSVSCDLVDASYADVLAAAPGRFMREDEHASWMLDHSGEEVDVEMTYTLLACVAECAVLIWSEHWQAGGAGTLTVYPTAEAYAQGLAEAKAWIAEHRSLDAEFGGEDKSPPW